MPDHSRPFKPFFFELAGHIYAQSEDQRRLGRFQVDGNIFLEKLDYELYTLLRAFVEHAIDARPIHLKVLTEREVPKGTPVRDRGMKGEQGDKS